MKRGVMLTIVIPVLFFIIPLSSAQLITQCVLDAKLINQDPYPAVPGDYVKVVFQLNGIEDPTCGEISFEFVEKFPFSLRQGVDSRITIDSGVYIRNYPNFLLAPYELLVDERAIDGENEVSVRYGKSAGTTSLDIIEEFNITIDNAVTDFEVSVKDYVEDTKTITFEILNIGEVDVEAVTIEIPKQDTIEIKGSNRDIIGDLDSNEDTTFTYEATPKNGEINLLIYYTDQINVRRSLEKTTFYDSSYFTDRKRDEIQISGTTYFFIIIIIIAVFFYVRYTIRKKKKKKFHQIRGHKY